MEAGGYEAAVWNQFCLNEAFNSLFERPLHRFDAPTMSVDAL